MKVGEPAHATPMPSYVRRSKLSSSSIAGPVMVMRSSDARMADNRTKTASRPPPSARATLIIYHLVVDRNPTTRSRAVSLLLCGLLTCLAIHSPHCDLCDELHFGGSSPQDPAANHPVPATQHDECNGACACCLFQGLPSVIPILHPTNPITTRIWIAPFSPVLAPQRSLFRPPRLLISS